MAIDQYAPCLCGSGKKLKWCCFDKLRDVAQIHRLISNKQFGHARETLDRVMRDEPNHPLFLMLKLEFFEELLDEHPEEEPKLKEEIQATAVELLKLRPHSTIAHHMLLRTGWFGTHQYLSGLLDYWERFGPAQARPSILAEYLTHLGDSDLATTWWTWPFLRGLLDGRGVPPELSGRARETLEDVAALLPGITSGPPFVPRSTVSPHHRHTMQHAVRCFSTGRLREAYATAHAIADEEETAAYLSHALTSLISHSGLSTGLLLGLVLSTSNEVLALASLIQPAVFGGLPFTAARRVLVGVPEDKAEEFKRAVSEEADKLIDPERARTALLLGQTWNSDAIHPDNIALLFEAEDDVRQLSGIGIVFEYSEWGPWGERIDHLLPEDLDPESGYFAVPSPIALNLVDSVVSLTKTLQAFDGSTAEDALEKYARRFVRGIVQHEQLNFGPKEDVTLKDLASSDDLKDRLIARTYALILERVIARGAMSFSRPWFVYEEFGVEPFRFVKGRNDDELPDWLAIIDLDNSSPDALISLVLTQSSPGLDIAAELIEKLLGRLEELSEQHRVGLVIFLVMTLRAARHQALNFFERISEAWQRALRSGLIPNWAADYMELVKAFARVALEADREEAHRTAATQLQRVLSRYSSTADTAEALKAFLNAVYGSRRLPGVPEHSPWQLMERFFSDLLGAWLIETQLVQILSDEELGLPPGEQVEEGSYFIAFRELGRWLDTYAEPVVVTPGSPDRLWTPDQGPPPSSTQSTPGEEQSKPRLWIPGQE